MKLAIFSAFVLAFAWSESVCAQSSLLFGRDGFGYNGYRVIPADDGGFWVGGEWQENSSGNSQYWVARFSARGEMVFDSIYGSDTHDFLWSIQPSKDGGVLLAGYTGIQWSATETALMLKLDSTGKVVARYNAVDSGRGIHSHFVGQRPQGGYMWTGHTVDPKTNDGVIVAGRLDKNFQPLWLKKYPIAHVTHAHAALVTPDGGIMIVGHTDSVPTTAYIAMRLDSNGTVLWSKLYQSAPNSDDEPYGISSTRSGGYAFFGGSYDNFSSRSTMWLLVVDSIGNVRANRHFGDGTAWGYSGIQSTDGGFVMIGVFGTNADSVIAVRTDSLGQTIWSRSYASRDNAAGYDLFQRDDRLVMVGESDSASISDLWLLYTDLDGKKGSYDTASSDARLLFMLDTTSQLWSYIKSDTFYGSIQNLSSDSIRFVYSQPKQAAFLISSTIGTKREIGAFDTLSIGPKETLPVIIIIQPYEPSINDTATFCFTVSWPANGTSIGSIDHCVTLYPTPANAVGDASENTNILSVYPNPVPNGVSRIQIVTPSGISLDKADLSDVMGHDVQTFDLHNSTVLKFESKNNPQIAPGVYFLSIRTSNGTQRVKIIVE